MILLFILFALVSILLYFRRRRKGSIGSVRRNISQSYKLQKTHRYSQSVYFHYVLKIYLIIYISFLYVEKQKDPRRSCYKLLLQQILRWYPQVTFPY